MFSRAASGERRVRGTGVGVDIDIFVSSHYLKIEAVSRMRP
jgi:hypothetical protein